MINQQINQLITYLMSERERLEKLIENDADNDFRRGMLGELERILDYIEIDLG